MVRWSNSKILFNCLHCISGHVLLYFFYFVKIFIATIWRHNNIKSAFCSFVHTINTELCIWLHFLNSGELLLSFARKEKVFKYVHYMSIRFVLFKIIEVFFLFVHLKSVVSIDCSFSISTFLSKWTIASFLNLFHPYYLKCSYFLINFSQFEMVLLV